MALAFDLGSEEAGCECQAHHSHSTKNNENDTLHGAIFFLMSRSWHWNSPFLCVPVLVIRRHSLSPLCLFHVPSTPVCTASNEGTRLLLAHRHSKIEQSRRPRASLR